MKELIIAEKPDLAKKIAQGIGGYFKRNDGYLENDNYVVTWAFGHLFGLIDVEQYDSQYDPAGNNYWSLDDLPFYPDKFKFALKKDDGKYKDGGVKKQFLLIKKLIERPDVSNIIHAGDSDREGEIIIRLILMNAGNKKPVKRLWLPDQTEKTIQTNIKKAESDEAYDNLANEGFARTFIDWLYGINLTRYCTLKGGKLLRVGRVISEIVNAIYERDMEIQNFVPEHYISVVSQEKTKGEEIKLTSGVSFEENEQNNAQTLCDKYNAAGAKVIDVQKREETISPGKLYSLSKLQGAMGKKYKIGTDETLAIVQKLYEAGYVTYPRTNTEYMATAEKDRVKSIISTLSASFPVAFKDSKKIFNDAKIESHSALTPTTKIPDLNSLSTKERNVYEAIRNRFVAVFCSEDCKVNRTTIKIKVGEYEEFSVSGDIMLQKGWTAFDAYAKKDKTLPDLKAGDDVNINFVPTAKETKPPSHFSTESLLEYLKNPFKQEKKEAKENDDEEYAAILNGLEIGTEATRATIISNAISSGYISLKNDNYLIEPAGVYYVETLKKLNVSMNRTKTVEISKALKEVYKGEKTVNESIAITKKEIDRVFETRDIILDTSTVNSFNSVGNCPVCGRPVKKNKAGYGCTGYKDGCRFIIFSTVASKRLTDKQVSDLLQNGKTKIIKGFISKSGKKFDAALKLEDGKVAFDFSVNSTKTKDININCPICGAAMKNDKWSWVCSNACGFKISHQIAGKALSEKDVEQLIKTGKTDKIKGFISKSGKKFEASLKLDGGVLSFDFS